MPGQLTFGIIGAGIIGDILTGTIRTDCRCNLKWIAAATQNTLTKKMTKFY